MIKDPGCLAPHIPVDELDSMVESELLRLASDPSLVDEIIKKRAAGDGGSMDGNRSEDVQRIDAEIGRLMDLYQFDDLVNVEEIASRIEKLHAEKSELFPGEKQGPRSYDVESFRLILMDVLNDWKGVDVRGRRAILLQLVDTVHVNEEGIVVDWSF